MRFLKLSILIVLIFTLALAAIFIYLKYFYRPDTASFPVKGIDVSHHQGDIDWQQVRADDVAFAFIKATEGGDHRDTHFEKNWQKAQTAGLKAGAYHFFTFCRPGRDQAENFITVLENRGKMLPPAVDLEFGGNCSDIPSTEKILIEVNDFLDRVERRTGVPTILYVTPEFWAAYKTVLPKRPLWIRSLFREPKNEDWSFWQYHNSSRVHGITGPVDLNVFRGNLDTLQNFEHPLLP